MDNVRMYTVEGGVIVTDSAHTALYAHVSNMATFERGELLSTRGSGFRLSHSDPSKLGLADARGLEAITAADSNKMFSPGQIAYETKLENGKPILSGRPLHTFDITDAVEIDTEDYESAKTEYINAVVAYSDAVKPIREKFDGRIKSVRDEWDAAKEAVHSQYSEEERTTKLSEQYTADLESVTQTFQPQMTKLYEEMDAAFVAQSGERPVLETYLANYVKSKSTLRVVSLQEYILSPQQLSRSTRMLAISLGDDDYNESEMPTLRTPSPRDNFTGFREDYLSGRLRGYEGTSVAYVSGVWCGQSSNGDILFEEAAALHGKDHLAVFMIPKKGAGKDTLDLMNGAKGKMS